MLGATPFVVNGSHTMTFVLPANYAGIVRQPNHYSQASPD